MVQRWCGGVREGWPSCSSLLGQERSHRWVLARSRFLRGSALPIRLGAHARRLFVDAQLPPWRRSRTLRRPCRDRIRGNGGSAQESSCGLGGLLDGQAQGWGSPHRWRSPTNEMMRGAPPCGGTEPAPRESVGECGMAGDPIGGAQPPSQESTTIISSREYTQNTDSPLRPFPFLALLFLASRAFCLGAHSTTWNILI
jgi:hypothetical protein